MQPVFVLLMIMMTIIYGGVEVVKCFQMYENEPEITDYEIRAFCSANPTLNICSGIFYFFFPYSNKIIFDVNSLKKKKEKLS